MIANEDRLQLILEANDRATAHLQKIRREIEATRGAADGASNSARRLGGGLGEIANRGPAIDKGTRAVTQLAFAAESATLGTRGAVTAMGTLAQTAASVIPRLAMFAPHIAAATIASGALLVIWQKIRDAKSEAASRDPFLEKGQSFDPTDPIWAQIAAEKKARDELERQREEASKRMVAAVARRNTMLRDLENETALGNAGGAFARQRLQLEQRAQANDDEIALLKKHGADVAALTIANEQWKNNELLRINDERISKLLQMERSLGDRMEDLRLEAAGLETGQQTARQTSSIAALADRIRRMGEIDTSAADHRYQLEEMRANREARAREEQIRAMEVSEEEKTRLLAQSEQARTHEVAIAERRQVQTVQEAAQQKRQAQVAQLHAMISAQKSLEKTLITIALNPIVKHLEGIAIEQGVKAAASFMNPAAAFKHAAAAALAIAGAHKVASLGGGSAGSGGASGAGGGGAEAARFEPRTPAGSGGGTVVQLIMRDPYGRESVQQTLHVLERAGFLNTACLEIPPTTGIQRVG